MNRTWYIVFGDILAFKIAFIILIFLRFPATEYSVAIQSHLIPFTILATSWIILFYVFGLYDLLVMKPTIPHLKRWISAIISAFILGMLFFYFIPLFGIAPKSNLLIQVLGFGISSFAIRRYLYRFLSKTITQHTIIVGNSSSIQALAQIIKNNPQTGLHITQHFDSIDEVVINFGMTKNTVLILDKQTGTLNEKTLMLYQQGIEIIDTAKAYEKHLYKIPVEYIDTSFMIENVAIKKDIVYTLLTASINILFSIIVLLITSPLLLIAIIARLIEDGSPIFIKQKRVGLNGKIFHLYKIRSMVALSKDGSAETDKAIWSTGIDDSRITKVGKILRKTHIDEIPQMFNILKGDINLVGPRPERPEFVALLEKEIPYYSCRHIIRPGFTGWAQIKYRYANTTESSKEKFEYDLYYIKNRNIFLDFGIILRTIQIIFTH